MLKYQRLVIKMIKVLFVCHGNICRSPMAEFLMKNEVKRRGIEKDFYIESRATSFEEIGNGVYPPVKKILNSLGINCDKKRAQRMTKADYEEYDYIVCMDSRNMRNMNLICEDRDNKYHKMLSFLGTDSDVADPWYTGEFDKTKEEITNGINAFLSFLGY